MLTTGKVSQAEPGAWNSIRCLTWEAGTQGPKPSAAAFPGRAAVGSRIQSGANGTRTLCTSSRTRVLTEDSWEGKQ